MELELQPSANSSAHPLHLVRRVLGYEKMIRIREEQPEDVRAIRELNKRAFGQPQEADIVDNLRQNCKDLLSLVAIMENQVVGHVLFSPATIEGDGKTTRGMGLAPMAVLPEYQRQGVGSELIQTGIARLRRRQCPFIIVLGHVEYYPRFGFKPANTCGIRCELEVPEDAFMILVLSNSEMQDISGVARYRPEFIETM